MRLPRTSKMLSSSFTQLADFQTALPANEAQSTISLILYNLDQLNAEPLKILS